MPEQFVNNRPFLIDIPRFNVRVLPGAVFTIPDDDAGSLYDDFPTAGDASVAYDTDGTPYATGNPGDLATDADGTPYVNSTLTVIGVDTDGAFYLTA